MGLMVPGNDWLLSCVTVSMTTLGDSWEIYLIKSFLVYWS